MAAGVVMHGAMRAIDATMALRVLATHIMHMRAALLTLMAQRALQVVRWLVPQLPPTLGRLCECCKC